MRPAVSLGLLCAIAGAVLLGLVTFCVPINKDLWLFTIKKSDLRLHCGVFGYCVDTKCSRTSLGYTFDRMSVPGTNWSLPNKGALSSDLTYVLVLFPVAFGLAVLAVICAFVAQFSNIATAVFAALLSMVSAIVATVAFAITFVLYFYARNHLEGADSGVEYGRGLWLSVAGAAVLYVGCILLWGGVHALRTSRNSHKNRTSFYRQLFAAPQHHSGITTEPVPRETYPEEHYALQPREAAAAPYDTTDLSLPYSGKAPSNTYYMNEPANDTTLTLGEPYEYAPYTQPYVHPDVYEPEVYSDAQAFLVPGQPGGVPMTLPGQLHPQNEPAASSSHLVDASALVPHVSQQPQPQPPGYARSNALLPEKGRPLV